MAVTFAEGIIIASLDKLRACKEVKYTRVALSLTMLTARILLQDGSFHVNRPSPKFVQQSHASASSGGALAPMTGTIEKVISRFKA